MIRDTAGLGARERLASLASEDQHLILVFDWARLLSSKHPELRNLYHVPNEGKREVLRDKHGRVYCPSGQRAKRKGLAKGYPDINLDIARHGFHGLRIELKRPGERPTMDQLDWLERLTTAGYLALICWGADPTIATIADYLSIDPGLELAVGC